MADFGDFLEGTAEAPAPTEASTTYEEQAVGGALVAQENGADADADAIFAAPAAVVVDDDFSGGAFFADYTPPVVPVPAATAPPSEPDDNDPRILWSRKNAEVLKKKDAEEAETKKKQQAKGKEFLTHFFDSRKTLVANRKGSNRTAEAAVKLEEVPRTGTAWEKVNVLVSSQAGVHHNKDVTRFKALLQTIKQRDVPITA